MHSVECSIRVFDRKIQYHNHNISGKITIAITLQHSTHITYLRTMEYVVLLLIESFTLVKN